MKLKDLLEKMRRADKVIIRQGDNEIFIGSVNTCRFQKDLADMEVDSFYPELIAGLAIVLRESPERRNYGYTKQNG